MNNKLLTVVYPWKATFCLTYRCNLRCGFCRIWEKDSSDELSFDEWIQVFKKSPQFLWIDFTGGEILTRPDWLDIISAAYNILKPFAIHLPTNGWLGDKLSLLAETKFKNKLTITVSIDGPTELHDKMRGRAGSWSRAAETLKMLRRLGIKSVAGMTLTKENEDFILETVSEIKRCVLDFKESELHINLAQISEHYYGNSRRDFEQAEKIPSCKVRFWPPKEFVRSILERRYLALLPEFLKTRRCPMPCKALTSSLFVSPQGKVYPCITDSRTIGNLRENGFNLIEILSSLQKEKLRQSIIDGDCPHCWTPCEAYPTVIESNSFLRLTKDILRAARIML